MEDMITKGPRERQCQWFPQSSFKQMSVFTLVVTIISFKWSFSVAMPTTTSICPTPVPQHTAAANISIDDVFLNVQHPVSCNGTAIAWKVCYYLAAGWMQRGAGGDNNGNEGNNGNEDNENEGNGEEGGEERMHSATVGVWRKEEGPLGIEQYGLHSSLDITINVARQVPVFNYKCRTIPIQPNERFDTLEGDIVGFSTVDVTSSQNVLNLMANTSQNVATRDWYVARKQRSGQCQYTSVSGLDLAVSCFGSDTFIQGYAMHVSIIVLIEHGLPLVESGTVAQSYLSTTGTAATVETTTTRSSRESGHMTTESMATTETMKNMDYTSSDLTVETSVSKISTQSNDVTTTAVNQSDINDEETTNSIKNQGMKNSMINHVVITATTVPTGIILLITMILVMSVVIVFVTVSRRRKTKLLNFKQRRSSKHHHIGLDHFVIVSDTNAIPSGSILSSTLNLESFPNEELQPSLPEIGTIEHPHIDTSEVFSNPIYEVNDVNSRALTSPVSRVHKNCIHQTNDHNDPGVNETDLEEPCAQSQTPIGSVIVDSSKSAVPGSRVNNEMRSSSFKRTTVTISNAKGGHKKSEIQNDYTQPKVAMDQQKHLKHYYQVLEKDIGNTGNEQGKYMEPANNVEDLYAQVQKQKVKEIPNKAIKVLEFLGKGEFGEVSRGILKSSKGGVIEVAVKTLVTSEKSTFRVRLLQEAAIMGQFFHPNVIKLIGVTTKKDKLMLVIELGSKGDLKKLLVSMLPDPGELLAPETDRLLLDFCQQIAFGMHYLTTKGFVHRDLAARNILVTEDNVLKISDFGMSRNLDNENYYISHGGMVPVKWTAPEAINYLKYSTASDVWSYGCLLYEIWSLGQNPFNDCSNSEALDKLETGYRLPPPPGCSRVIYSIMINCWHPEAQVRPIFKDILLELLDEEEDVLEIPKKDAATHKLAGLVGGPLEAGEKMYTDLQWKYFTPDDCEQQI